MDAYERLQHAKRHPSETFSSVVRRAVWLDAPMSGAEILAHLQTRAEHLSEEDLVNIEHADDCDAHPILHG